jgi:tetratricopeptide (TPR) repeat protein
MRFAPTILLTGLLVGSALPLAAQQISPSTPPPPPPAEPAEPAKPAFDPYHAEKSIEIGTFYFKKGNYDAAIDRFEEATHYEPSLAKPWRLLGEAYEKKHDYGRAIESYKKYLDVFPGAPDAAQIKKRIGILEERKKREAPKRAPH